MRKCGIPQNMLDVLSLRVFNGEVTEQIRQEFVAARYLADMTCSENPFATIEDIYNKMEWTNPSLRCHEDLIAEELACEKMLLTPVLKMREMIDALRIQGHRIVYISDMYLPEAFIREVMTKHGFLQKGDSLYVSCAVGKRKSDGTLYQYVQEKEGLSYKQWHHYGDNKSSDVAIPKRLGIKAHLIEHKYTPYQKQWLCEDYTVRMKIGGILAGLGRSLCCSSVENSHRDFMLDIVAPFYASSVYRLMQEAHKNGVRRLYFCARDAYSLYLVARQFVSLFKDLEVEYLYISQKALYEGDEEVRMAYYEQIGLATKADKVAIVDVRSSGHTAVSLNEQLLSHGFCKVGAYYFEMFCCGETRYIPSDYYTEVNKLYLQQNPSCSSLVTFWQLYEMFFSIHNQERTLGYCFVNDEYHPIFDKNNHSDKDEEIIGNGYVLKPKYWGGVHEKLLDEYVTQFIALGLYKYADECFERIAIPTLIHFVEMPDSHYLPALEDFMVYDNWRDYVYKPYVKKYSLFHILCTRGRDTCWKRGTLILSLPSWMLKICLLIKGNNI